MGGVSGVSSIAAQLTASMQFKPFEQDLFTGVRSNDGTALYLKLPRLCK